MTTCPCGAGRNYADCCGRFIEGRASAPTAEALMRSRYTAYVKARIEYVSDTHDPQMRSSFDAEKALEWAESSEWLGLEIVSTRDGSEGDDVGTVEFVASFRADGDEREHRERSAFVRRNGKWYYKDGRVLGPRQVRAEGPKIGRNDPCHCGSGKKYKKCCGRA